MTNQPNADISRQLIKARKNHKQWDVSDIKVPKTVEESYEIQEVIRKQLGAKIGGWKTSAPDPISIPIAAPIYANLIFDSGAKVPASDLFLIGIEGEIAFRMDRNLPIGPLPFSRNDVIKAVGDLIPAIEIVDTRMLDGLSQDKKLVLADNQSNGGLVIGEPMADWQGLDFAALQASVMVNGVTAYSGVDGNRAGDVFDLMAWAANHCASRGTPFCVDDIITTGTYTGMLFVEPGAEVIVDFPGIGRIEVSFPA